MDNIFLDENIEMNGDNYVNENNIIDRDLNLVQCEDNQRNLYDIDKLIVKDVYRENILLSDKDTNDSKHDSKTLRFNLNNDKAGGIQYKKNVIGFRLNECIYTSPVFNITEGNNTINFNYNDTYIPDSIKIPKGFYTIFTLLNTINSSTLVSSSVIVNTIFNLTYDTTTSRVKISVIATNIEFTGNTSLIYILGFQHQGLILHAPVEVSASTHPSLNIGTYIDIVVDEIPYKACKQNPQGLNIVHRLPVRPDSGSSIVYYKSNFIDHNFQYLFYPINLSTLTIHLYMDGEELNLEHMTISFEFELVILNK
jgi:hypothetical protein